MPRKRTIKPGFFVNEDLGECSPLARLFFAGLWCWADREGRLEDRPRRLRAEILPYDQADGEQLMSELASHGFVLRYEIDDQRLVQIVNFQDHQDPHPRESPSEFPRPPQGEPKASPGLTLGEPRHSQGSASPSCPSRSLELASLASGGEPEANLRQALEEQASGEKKCNEILDTWNRICVPAGFAKARGTPQQLKALRTRLREPGWPEAFLAACTLMASDPFYRGAGSTGWVADFGWLLKPGNAEKTADKAITRRATGPPVKRRDVIMSAESCTDLGAERF